MEKLENDDYVLSKVKAIQIAHYTILAFIVRILWFRIACCELL